MKILEFQPEMQAQELSFLDEKHQIETVITFKVNSADQNCLSNWFKDVKPDLLALLEDML
jgi:hypothetical protein